MDKIKCSICGTENDSDAIHCKKCGCLLSESRFDNRFGNGVMDQQFTDVLNQNKFSFIAIAVLSIASILGLIFGRNFFFYYWENISENFPNIFGNTFALWLAVILMVFVTNIFILPKAAFKEIPNVLEKIMQVLLILLAIGCFIGLWGLIADHLSKDGFFQILFSLILALSITAAAFFFPIRCYFDDVTTKSAIVSVALVLLAILVVIFLCLTGCWLFNHQNVGSAIAIIIVALVIMGVVSSLQFVIVL